jgi:hypothetical protein
MVYARRLPVSLSVCVCVCVCVTLETGGAARLLTMFL